MSTPFLRTLSAARSAGQPASPTRLPARPRAALLALLALLLVLAFSAAPALAAAPPCTKALIESKLECQFGAGQGSGAGQFEGVAVAVDDNGELVASAGDVYVADRNNNRVDRFSADGEFLLAWGWGVADGKAELQTCGPQSAPLAVVCQAGLGGGGAGEMFGPGAVAVDSSTEPLDASKGDVYVEDLFNRRVDKFTADGEFLLAWGEGVADGKEEAQLCGPEAPVHTCQAALGAGEGPGEFEAMEAGTIATDTQGTVYVGDNARVQEFEATGAFTLQVSVGLPEEPMFALALDPSGNIFVGRQAGVHEYKPCLVSCVGEELQVYAPEAFAGQIGVGSSGELFLGHNGRVDEYAGTPVQAASFPGSANSLAFAGASGELYLLESGVVRVLAPPVLPPVPLIESEEAAPEPAGTATLRVSVDPEGSQTKYHVSYGVEGSPPLESEPVTMTGEGFEPETVEVKLAGLVPGAVYHFHLLGENANGTGEGAEQTFTALPALQIDSESVSQVTSASARLVAQINPLGSETTYRFTYGPTSACGGTECSLPASEGHAGSGVGDVPVSVLVEGLSPSTAYHYRLTARNPLAPEGITGPERTFTTQPVTAPAGVIDGRSWEMVSPPDKHGAPLEMSNEEAGVIQAADNGGAFSYFALAPAGEDEPAGNRSFAYTQLLSTRSARGVWGTEDIATPQKNVQGLISGGPQSEYKLFSSDLAQGLAEPEGGTLLSPQATERTPYLRNSNTGEYVPLLPATGLRPGTKFGGKEQREGGEGFEGGVEFVTGTPDFSHVVLASQLALTGDFEAGFEKGPESLYEWSGGELKLVSILPGAAHPAAEAGFASRLGGNGFGLRGAISTDGTRLVSDAESGTERHLYLRDTSLGRTVQLDTVAEGVVNAGQEEPLFLDATPDASRVFFLDRQRLTSDSAAGVAKPDLYMCQVTVSAGELKCALKDLTVSLSEGEPGNLLGADLGVDHTGTYVYFVASGVLAPGAVAGEPNLYIENTSTRATRLIATLSSGDAADWRAGDERPDKFSELTSRVSANGRFVTFMSERPLTGYDNVDARSGHADEEVFLYDREAASLRCVSCNPTGARPAGVFDPGATGEAAAEGELPLLVDNSGVWKRRWLAGSLPGWPLVDNFHALYDPRNLTDTGRLFFDSADALVPTDSNGREDVYEFEPEGVGGCRLAAGCVGLVSSGTSSEESAFMDASGVGPGGEEGEDVFFMTAAKLASQDVDTAMDVYDAHTCSTAAPCASGVTDVPPACSTTDSCRAAPVPLPRIFGVPSTGDASGPGNPVPPPSKARTAREVRAEKLARALKACRAKHSRRKRRACEKQAHRAYGAIARRSAHVNRRAR